MNTLVFGLLTIFSLFIFLKLGKIKASSRQLNRANRIKWGRNQNKSSVLDTDNPKLEAEKLTKISDQPPPTSTISDLNDHSDSATLPDESDSGLFIDWEEGINQDAENEKKGATKGASSN